MKLLYVLRDSGGGYNTDANFILQFTPITLAKAALMDPKIHVTAYANLTFTLSAKGGVGAWTWLDHPANTVGYFFDTSSSVPSNGLYLIPGQDRTG